MASDRDLGTTYFVGIERFPDLSEENQRQFFLLLYSQFKLLERLHYQFCQGNIEEELWNLEAESLHLLIHSPVFEAWWEVRWSLFRLDFQRAIERLRGEEAHMYSEQLRNAMMAKLRAAQQGDD